MALSFQPTISSRPSHCNSPSCRITGPCYARQFFGLKTCVFKAESCLTTNFFSSSVPGVRIGKLSSHWELVGVVGKRRGVGIYRAGLDALIFDCDGVILESEDLHRRAYNLTFENFDVKCGPHLVNWDPEFYDVLQNTIGGGKPKMRCGLFGGKRCLVSQWTLKILTQIRYFGKNGWPSSTVLDSPPQTEIDQATLIDTLQDWKTNKYQGLISSGAEPRPGVLQLMDEAFSSGIKVAVCSAATKSSVVFCLNNLLGKGRFERLDCFLAGDDVKNKKPDPSIYEVAAEKLGAKPELCLVVEDSVIGLQAALGAGMNCVITYTSSTAKQDFNGAKAIYSNMGGVGLKELISHLDGEPAVLYNP